MNAVSKSYHIYTPCCSPAHFLTVAITIRHKKNNGYVIINTLLHHVGLNNAPPLEATTKTRWPVGQVSALKAIPWYWPRSADNLLVESTWWRTPAAAYTMKRQSVSIPQHHTREIIRTIAAKLSHSFRYSHSLFHRTLASPHEYCALHHFH
jgi:hypothetical protein